MIKVAADDCYNKVKEIDEKFERWLMHCMELHAACMQTQSTNDERLSTTEMHMAVAQTLLDSEKDSVEKTKKITSDFAKQVELATETFKQASEEYPSGFVSETLPLVQIIIDTTNILYTTNRWDIIGQQVVSSIAETTTAAIGQLVKGFASTLNPIAAASNGLDLFRSLVQ
jgi:hypothetical protein